jgi:hypothetical protein
MRVIAVALLLAAYPVSVFAHTGPICREPSVVDEIGRQVKSRDYYAKVEAHLITEEPTREANVVRCQVCVLTRPYLMSQFGDKPVPRCLPAAFDVRAVGLGFVVRALP